MIARSGSRLDDACFAFLLVAVVLIPTPTVTGLPWFGGAVQASDLAVAAAAVCFVLDRVIRRRLPELTAYHVGAVVYLGGGALSLLQHPAPVHGAIKLVGVGSLVATMVLVAEVCRARRREVVATAWLLATAVVCAATVVGIVSFYVLGHDSWPYRLVAFAYGSLPQGNYPRVDGLQLNANMFCDYLVVSAGILAWRWGSTPRRAALALAAAIALSAFFTLSTGWGGFAVGAIILLAGARPGAVARFVMVGLGAFAAFMALITVLAIVPPGQGVFPILGPFGDLSDEPSGRWAAWMATIDTIRQHPLLGVGIGEPVAHFTHRWANQGMSGGPRAVSFHLEAHQVWLGIWAQMGIFAVAGFAWMAGSLARLARAAAAPLWAALAGALFYHGLFASLEDTRHVWVLFGLIAGQGSWVRTPTSSTPAQSSSTS